MREVDNKRAAQLLAEFAAMGPDDMAALLAWGERLARGRGRFESGRDLLNEALHLALIGKRSWPEGVPAAVFLGNAMRSIANGDRRRAEAQAGSRLEWSERLGQDEEDARSPSAEEVASDIQSRKLGPSQLALARTRLDPGDSEALGVIDCALAGLDPAAARRELGLDWASYEAAVARISSAVAAGLAGGPR